MGGYHGALRVLEDVLRKDEYLCSTLHERNMWERILCCGQEMLSMLTVFVLVCIGWIFFRANNVGDAFYILTHILSGISDFGSYILNGYRNMGLNKAMVVEILFFLLMLTGYDRIALKQDLTVSVERSRPVFRWIIYYLLIWMIILMGNFGSNPFVYFQF